MIFISHLFSFISTPRVKEDFYINTSIVTICLIWPSLSTIPLPPGGHEIYNFGRPFPVHYSDILNFSY